MGLFNRGKIDGFTPPELAESEIERAAANRTVASDRDFDIEAQILEEIQKRARRQGLLNPAEIADASRRGTITGKCALNGVVTFADLTNSKDMGNI